MDVLEIAPNLNKTVYYKDFYNIPDWTAFTLSGCTVRKDPRGMLHYTAELSDANGRCVINAKIENVRTSKEHDT